MLAKQFAFSFGIQVSSFVLNTFGSIIVARLMGPTVLGNFSSMLAMAMLFSIIGEFGLGNANLKIYPQYEDKGACVGSFIVLKLMAISSMILVICLFLYLKRLHMIITIWFYCGSALERLF